MQVKIEPTDPNSNLHGVNLNVERGIFEALLNLIYMDNNIVWDPVGAFFCLTGGYRVQRNGTGGAAYDPYEQEIFLTDSHVNKLFAVATAKRSAGTRGFLGRFARKHSR
ncbi:MAG: hypothetical protein J5742_00555 [Alphaproteobacteria bacterium]|nr:hypothetical protein [Alphaproteobacteria bacterium]